MSELEDAVRAAAGRPMVAAARSWLDSLTSDQTRAARHPPPGQTGTTDQPLGWGAWFYTPTDHGGLALHEQSPAQQQGAMRLVATGTSEAGFATLATVMGLENVLERLEDYSRDWGFERGRDPARYWLRVFGAPGDPVWGWRFAGHHLSLNILLRGDLVMATTPSFLGADPARSALLGGDSLRPLGGLEDLGRRLAQSLDEAQVRQAVLHPRPPSDIIGGNRDAVRPGDEMLHMNDTRLWGRAAGSPRLSELLEEIDRSAEDASGYVGADHAALAIPHSPAGVPGAALREDQRHQLRDLVRAYVERAPAELASARMAQLDLDDVHFGWAGDLHRGGHYYRLHGSGLLVEYDNTQRGANHVHSVWREPDLDFGGDPLLAHRRSSHA